MKSDSTEFKSLLTNLAVFLELTLLSVYIDGASGRVVHWIILLFGLLLANFIRFVLFSLSSSSFYVYKHSCCFYYGDWVWFNELSFAFQRSIKFEFWTCELLSVKSDWVRRTQRPFLLRCWASFFCCCPPSLHGQTQMCILH